MKYTKDYKGTFVLPNKPEKTLFGLLKFTNGIAYLDLLGSFFSMEGKIFEADIIYGFLDNGNTCIFNNCILEPPNPFQISTYVKFKFFIHASSEIFNKNSKRNFEFSSLRFRLDFLTHWTGINVYQPYINKDGGSGITKISPDLSNYVLYEDENFILRISHRYSSPFISPYSNYLLEQESSLFAEIVGNVSYEDIFLFVQQIEDLFSLMNGRETLVTTPIILIDTEDHSIPCYINRPIYRLEPIILSESNNFIYEPILNYEYLKEYLMPQDFFKEWHVLLSKFSYSVLKVVEAIRKKPQSSESIFLNLVFALEKFIEIDKKYVDKVESLSPKELKQLEVLKNHFVPENTINFFKTRLKKTSSLKLKDKVTEYLKEYGESLEFILGKDTKLFINKLVDSRNHLAHLCNNCTYQIDSEEYPLFNRKLLMLLMFMVFSKLKLPKKDIALKITTNPSFHIRQSKRD